MCWPTLHSHGPDTYASHHNSELDLYTSCPNNALSSSIVTVSQITHPSVSLPLLFIPVNRLHHILAIQLNNTTCINTRYTFLKQLRKIISILCCRPTHRQITPSIYSVRTKLIDSWSLEMLTRLHDMK